jgi:O-antigen/teichoic acid export membrane protein
MVLRLLLVLYLISITISLEKLFIYYAILEIIMMIVDFIIYTTKIHRFSFSVKHLKSVFLQMIPFGVAGLFMTIYDKIDITFLSKLLPENPNLYIGWYSSAYELMSALIFIPAAITSAIMPVAYKSNKEELAKLYKTTFSAFISIALAICIGTTILAEPIINLIYGAEFTGSIIALQILIWALLFNFAMFVSGIILNSINMEKETMKATIISVIFNVVGNIIFIPRYGYLAAAYTTLGSVFLYNIYCFAVIQKKFMKLPYFSLLWKGVLSSLIMGFVVYFLKDWFFVSALTGMVVFFELMFLLKGFDYDLVKKIIKKNGSS